MSRITTSSKSGLLEMASAARRSQGRKPGSWGAGASGSSVASRAGSSSSLTAAASCARSKARTCAFCGPALPHAAGCGGSALARLPHPGGLHTPASYLIGPPASQAARRAAELPPKPGPSSC
jgi:hypothetical protein